MINKYPDTLRGRLMYDVVGGAFNYGSGLRGGFTWSGEALHQFDRPTIFASDHDDYFDITALGFPVLKERDERLAFMTRDDLLDPGPEASKNARMFGSALRLMGGFSVIRGELPSEQKNKLEYLAMLHARGISVAMFPQGTRKGHEPDSANRRDYHEGLAMFAVHYGFDVVAAAVVGTKEHAHMHTRYQKLFRVEQQNLDLYDPDPRVAAAARKQTRPLMLEIVESIGEGLEIAKTIRDQKIRGGFLMRVHPSSKSI